MEKLVQPSTLNFYEWNKYEYDLAAYLRIGEMRRCPFCGTSKIKQSEDDIFCNKDCKRAFELLMNHYKK